MTRLERWIIGRNSRLIGFIYDDKAKRFPDGYHIETSPVVAYDPKDRIATTRSGTHYILHDKGPHKELSQGVGNGK